MLRISSANYLPYLLILHGLDGALRASSCFRFLTWLEVRLVSSCSLFSEDGYLAAGCGRRPPLLFISDAALAVILTDPEAA